MSKIDMKSVTLIAFENGNLGKIVPAISRCIEGCNFYDVKLLTCFDFSDVDINCKKIKVRPTSYSEYGNFMLKDMGDGLGFVGDYVDSDFMLFIHWDGYVLNPSAWSDDFLQYDYIGARWGWEHGVYNVGNGGFTLRSKKLLDFIKKDPKFSNTSENEDWYICNTMRPYLELNGFVFAPGDVADRFSVESTKWTGSFGAHYINRFPESDPRYTDISSWKVG